MSFRERMYRIGMALCGPAETGPYGPPVPPPIPRPRDARGRLIKETKRTRRDLARAASIAAAVTVASISGVVQLSDSPTAGAQAEPPVDSGA